MHITVNGVALHEMRRGLSWREHVLVGGEVLKRPSVDHSGGGGVGGGGGWIGDVGVVSEGDEIWGGRVLQIVQVKLLVGRLQERRLVSGASGSWGLKALGDLWLLLFRSDPRERSRLRSCNPPEGARKHATQLRATRSTMFSKAATGTATVTFSRKSTGLNIEYLTRQ